MARTPKDRFNQVAALPFRIRNGRLEVLLVTSRETKRWLIPKGWPIKGKKAYKAAAQEAMEEAGVKGSISQKAIGHYDYWKRRAEHFDLCRVEVYPLEVSKQLKKWPEKGERDLRWFEVEEAAQQVLEPALAAVIRGLPMHVPQLFASSVPALAE
jgi:8-oxo-dGTP pyrophosphatase MutT (NUDIX family)